MKDNIRNFVKKNVSWVILVILCIAFSIAVPQFRTVKNVMTILKQIAVSGICSVGVCFVMICGQMDMSSSAQIALSGVVCSLLVTRTSIPFPIVILITAACTMLVGLINGSAVVYLHMPAIIATLGSMNIASGITYLLNGGIAVYGLPSFATFIGQATILGGIPISALLMGFCMILGAFILNKTKFGRLCFAVGSNSEAARLTGINVNMVKMAAFLLASAFISIAGIVLMARINSGVPTAGSNLFLDVIIACIIGGVSSSGGEGNFFGLLGGVLVMGVMANGMSVMGLPDYIQDICKGVIFILSVGVDSYRRFAVAERKAHVIRTSSGEIVKGTKG
ncbi:MAG: ABC transporter permease [Oscillospiraceae bacterium]|nr:ABC transporter permease [Oscillospiraceae bacterium]